MKTILIVASPGNMRAKAGEPPVEIVSAIRLATGLRESFNVAITLPHNMGPDHFRDHGWQDDFYPLMVEMPKWNNAPGNAFSQEFIDVFVQNRAIIPYDIVFNFVPPTSLGLKGLIANGVYSVIDIPIVTMFRNNGSSYDKYNMKPQGSRLRHKYMEIPEAYSPIAGAAFVECATAKAILLHNMRKLMSPSQLRIASQKVFQVTRPEFKITKAHRHKYKKGEPFTVLLAGGFGKEHEGIPKQAEAAVKAIADLYALGVNVRLEVCSTSPETDWTKKLLKGKSKFVTFHYMPDDYAKRFHDAHVGLFLRPLVDCRAMVMYEMMMAGKPVIWYDSIYTEGMVNRGYHPIGIKEINAKQIAAAVKHIMSKYAHYSALALEGAPEAAEEKSPRTYHDTVEPIARSLIAESEKEFRRAKYDVWVDFFKGLRKSKPIKFEELWKKSCKKHALSLYSRIWFAKMLERMATKEVIVKDSEFWVMNRR